MGAVINSKQHGFVRDVGNELSAGFRVEGKSPGINTGRRTADAPK
jgi:hypothetical protein